jgi:hypothetical protein
MKIKHDFIWKYIEHPKRMIMSGIHKTLGWGNAEIIQHEVNIHRNELVLDTFDIVKLLGWTDQYDEDYYWIIQHPYYNDIITLTSCVGGFVWLKNSLSLWDYTSLLRTFDWNSVSDEDVKAELQSKSIILK